MMARRPTEASPALRTLLLDTHVWIWMAEGEDRRLSEAAIHRVEAAGRALALPGIFLLDLSPRSALDGALLPTDDLVDPVDRMLVAAARIEDATLVTADRRILDYGASGRVRTLAAW